MFSRELEGVLTETLRGRVVIRVKRPVINS